MILSKIGVLIQHKQLYSICTINNTDGCHRLGPDTMVFRFQLWRWKHVQYRDTLLDPCTWCMFTWQWSVMGMAYMSKYADERQITPINSNVRTAWSHTITGDNEIKYTKTIYLSYISKKCWLVENDESNIFTKSTWKKIVRYFMRIERDISQERTSDLNDPDCLKFW